MCELNGGKIGFSSEPNKGSTVWLTFSEVSLDETGDTGTNLEVPEGKGQGQTVLLFESDGGERKIIERYLTRIGFKILSFASCKISTNDLRGMQPALVILDSKIVDTQGDSVIAEIRELCPGAPLVLISSKAFVFDIEKQLKAGIDRSLSKPIALKELGRVCEALISPTQSDNYV